MQQNKYFSQRQSYCVLHLTHRTQNSVDQISLTPAVAALHASKTPLSTPSPMGEVKHSQINEHQQNKFWLDNYTQLCTLCAGKCRGRHASNKGSRVPRTLSLTLHWNINYAAKQSISTNLYIRTEKHVLFNNKIM